MKIRHILTIAILTLLLQPGTSAASQWPESFTLRQILSAPFPTELIAAPTGSRVAWVLDAQGKRNIWVAEGPSFKARQLTPYNEDDGQELTNLTFTHDGEGIVYVRGGDENAAGEVPNPTNSPNGARQEIHVVSWKDGRVRRLSQGSEPVVSPVGDQVVFLKDGQVMVVSIAEGSEPHPLFAARGNNGSITWSPDGKRLAFVSRRNPHSLIGVYDLEKESLRYVSPSVDRDTTPRWSADGKRIAFIRQLARANRQRSVTEDSPDPWTIVVANPENNSLREVWQSERNLNGNPPRMAGEFLLQWGADDRLIFASEMDGWMRLYSIPSTAGTATALTPARCEFEHATLTSDRRQLIYSSNCNDIDRRHLAQVPVAGGPPVALTTGEGIEWSPAVTGDGKSLFFAASDAKRPAMPQVMTLNGSDRKTLASDLLPSDFPTKLLTPRQVVFKSADGVDVHGQLFEDTSGGGGAAGGRRPAVIFMHGGPSRQMMLGWHNLYYYHNAYAFNQYLASRGYVVLSVNYRAGIGYGRAFREATKRGARGAAEYQDVVAGAQFLSSYSSVDGGRIGLWGGSYGGFLTALGLARNSDIFAAGVDIHGVHDWSLRISASPWIDYNDRDAQKVARESSPMNSVATWRSPVLLVHGDDDRNVAFAQTVDLVQKLREQKVYFEQLVFPDEIHDFLLHRHWLEIYDASANFLDRFLKNGKPTDKVSRVDVLIRRGNIVDGTGTERRTGDVGILGDRIVFVGDATKEGITASREVDASGLIVAPGFIDPHTHTVDDLSSAEHHSNQAYLFQGVTTVVTGNDGSSPFPVGKTLAEWAKSGLGTNAALFIGHGTVRRLVIGQSDAAPTAEQLGRMKEMVARAMDEGAIGLSTGLYYAPGSYATTEEVIELAKVAAAHGGIYDSHMRDESSYSIGLLGSIDETIRIGREAGLPVHISHIKALGTDVWGQSREVIARINRARLEGINVSANQYPYNASGTSLTASLVPRWAEVGGVVELRKRIDDPASRAKLVVEMEANLKRRGGADSLLITYSEDRALVGKRLSAIARERGKSAIEASLEIIRSGGASVASFNMNDQDIDNFMREPWVMTGSDGSSGHPRKYGTYPRKLREYVYNRRVLSLPVAIRAGSSLVAETFRLAARGRIQTGYFADLIVFDERTVADRSTYEKPDALAVGMKYVLVNGQFAISDGRYTGALAGQALRQPRAEREASSRADDGR
ncbi:MAG: prolyl oligopeptidase family serine peptidase [Acidobacteriota bacterium]